MLLVAGLLAETAAAQTVPGAPTPLAAQRGDPDHLRVRFSWDAPADDGGSPITGYELRWGFNRGAESVNTIEGDVRFFDIRLVLHAGVYLRVRAKNAVGWGPLSSILSLTDAPAAPTGLAVRRLANAAGTVRFEWGAGAASGTTGLPVTAYRWQYENLENPGFEWSQTFETVAGVTEGVYNFGDDVRKERRFRVVAVNAADDSDTASVTLPAATVPGAPSNPMARRTGTGTQIRFAWDRPAHTGGLVLTGYQLQGRFQGGGTTNPADSTHEGDVTEHLGDGEGVALGTQFEFRVRVRNALGYGPWSAWYTLSDAVPGVPTNLAAVRTGFGNGVRFSWDAPADDGGWPITGYELRAGLNGGAAAVFTIDGDVRSSVQPFSIGPGVYFAVSACNAIGCGETSAVHSIVDTPAAPVGLAVERNAGAVRISWSPPPDNGLSVTGYVWQYENLENPSFPWSSEMTVGAGVREATRDFGADAAKARLLRVRARNTAGAGAFAQIHLPAATVPGAPTGLGVMVEDSSGTSSFTLSWTAPMGGVPITQYQYQWRLADIVWQTGNIVTVGTDTSIVRSITHTTAPLDRPIEFRVRAGNSHGNGPWSNTVTLRTAPTVADMSYVKAHGATVGTAFSLTLPAASGGGGAPYDYTLRHRGTTDTFNAGVNGLTFDPATRVLSGTPSDSGLWPLDYEVHDGDSNRGAGDRFVQGGAFGLTAAPRRVTGVAVEQGPGAGEVTVSWDRPRNGADTGDDAGVKGYVVQAKAATLPGAVDLVTDPAVTSHTLTGLTQGGEYGVTVFAGAGEFTGVLFTVAGALSAEVTVTVASGPTVTDTSYVKAHGATVGTPFSLTLPVASGGDGTPYEYTLRHRGTDNTFNAGVNGLTFDPATRTLSGTPSASGAWQLDYEVHDGDADRDDSDRFVQGGAFELRVFARAPGNLMARPDGSGRLVLTWERALNGAGTAPDPGVTGYAVTSTSHGGFDATLGAAATAHTVTGLTDGTEYDWKVVAISGAVNGAGADISGTPQAQPRLSVQASTPPVTEGADVVFRIESDLAFPGDALTVNVRVSGGETFLAGPAPGSVTLPTSGQSHEVRLPTTDDSAHEPDADVTLELLAGPGYAVNASQPTASVTVQDNDDAVVIGVAAESVWVAEGAGARFRVTASRAVQADTEVRFQVRVEDDGEERWLPDAAVTIPAGATSAVLVVPTRNDDLDEPNGSVTVYVLQGEGYSPSGDSRANRATVGVRDDEPAPGLMVVSQRVREGSGLDLPVTATGRTTAPYVCWADLHDSRSTAVAGDFEGLAASDEDYETGPGVPPGAEQLRFLASTDRYLNVWAVQDNKKEGEETLVVRCKLASGAGGTASGTVTIGEGAGPDPVVADPPRGLAATTDGETAVELRWRAPAKDGGSPVVGYWIEVSEDGGGSWTDLATVHGPETAWTHGVGAGQTRHYRVAAVNAAGIGYSTAPVRGATAAPAVAAPPTVSDASAFADHAATVGEAFSLTLPAADPGSGDGAPYEYILWKRNAGVHFGENGLTFDAATRTVSGTPEAAGTHALAYQIHDGDADRSRADSFVEETALRITVGDAPAAGASPPAACVSDLGALAAGSDVALDGEAWDAPDCRAHHRENRPARYFSFTLEAPATVTLALTSDSAASLFVSKGAPENGWGTPPGSSMEDRLATRRANGKLVHEAGLTASLALAPGGYTAEAVLEQEGADPASSFFGLAIEAAAAGTADTAPTDTAPTVSDTAAFADHEATVGEAFSLVLPAADAGSGNGGPYSYALYRRGQGASFEDGIDGLAFDPATRTLSGTPEREGVYALSYAVHDGDENTQPEDAFRENESLQVSVSAAAAPVVAKGGAPTVSDAAAFTNHEATAGEAFSLTLPAADAGSGDGGPYEYILWKRGAGVRFGENGLVFDPATRIVSGTPAAPGTFDLAYQVHDGDDDRSLSDSFVEESALRITVSAGTSNAEPADTTPPDTAPPADDAPLWLNVVSRTVGESAGTVGVRVRANRTTPRAFRCWAARQDPRTTATADVDFTAARQRDAQMLDFSAGTTGSFYVTVLDDTVAESVESVTVRCRPESDLSDASGGADGLLTIADDDDPAVSVGDARTNESDGAIAFSLTLDSPARSRATVAWATADGTATAGEDYAAASGTVAFAPGERHRTVSVTILDDAHDEGEETLRVVLSDAHGLAIGDGEAVGTIVNTDPMPKAWLARFGRAASMHVADAIAERLGGGTRQGAETQFTLGGRRVEGLFARSAAQRRPDDATAHAFAEALQDESPAARMARMKTEASAAHGGPAGGSLAGGSLADGSFAGRSPSAGRSPAGGSPDAWMLVDGLLEGSGWAGGQGLADGLRLADGLGRMDWTDVLAGSSFDYTRTGVPGSEARGLSRFSAWGRGAQTRFSGAAGPLSVDGEVVTATLGADAQWGRWTGGVAVSHSLGEGGYTGEAAAGGTLTSTLTSLNPYAHYEFNDRTSLWGLLGYGVGDLTLTPETAQGGIGTDLKNTLAAFGGRGVFARRAGGAGALELAVVSDALTTDTVSEAAVGLVGAEGRTSRVRLMLEGSGAMALWNGAALRPTLEAGLRYDGGDAEIGAGIEIGGGLSYAAGPLAVELTGRLLLAHEDANYEESGYSIAMKWQPGEDGRGLSMNLGSSWGRASSGVRTLWGGQSGAGLGTGMAHGAAGTPAQRFQTEFGYGFEGRKAQGLWTPFLATESGEGHRAYRLGLKLTAAANAEAALEIGRRESPGGAPEDEVRLQGRVRW